MEPLNERLLTAWLYMSTVVVNPRIVSELSYKETLVCNALYKNRHRQEEQPLTATALCQQTKMLKSQMNRTLTSLEDKGLVVRERSRQDKRRILVRFNPSGATAYESQHRRILKLLDGIIQQIGEEAAAKLADSLTRVADVTDALLSG